VSLHVGGWGGGGVRPLEHKALILNPLPERTRPSIWNSEEEVAVVYPMQAAVTEKPHSKAWIDPRAGDRRQTRAEQDESDPRRGREIAGPARNLLYSTTAALKI